mmetsp:Transcript_13403/g.31551  ORF Transcript_13403/g.31551 Transcript_13403/m.31551 type:complete len:205 (-) Transcript_13403:224-838(-)
MRPVRESFNCGYGLVKLHETHQRVIGVKIQCSRLVECVAREFHGNGTVHRSDDIVHVETIFAGCLDDVVDCVTLVDALHEGIDWHRLLPELEVSDQFVALSVIAECNVIVVLLRNYDISHDGFSFVSSGLDLISILRRLRFDSHVVQCLQQSRLVEKLGLNGAEVAVQRGRRTGTSIGRCERTGTRGCDSNKGCGEGLHCYYFK